MATGLRSGTLGLIQTLFDEGTCTGLSDARLLERFVTHRDEAAFTTLVVRHGPMVLRTCQGILDDPSAVDDAFQATFVLLFRKAGSIRACDALAAWLHRVAYRVSNRRGDLLHDSGAARPRARGPERQANGRRTGAFPDRRSGSRREIRRPGPLTQQGRRADSPRGARRGGGSERPGRYRAADGQERRRLTWMDVSDRPSPRPASEPETIARWKESTADVTCRGPMARVAKGWSTAVFPVIRRSTRSTTSRAQPHERVTPDPPWP